MNERKETKQMNSDARGQRFRMTAMDATMPTQQTNISMWLLEFNQRSVGANQKRFGPGKYWGRTER
jgi:hypothetical protein